MSKPKNQPADGGVRVSPEPVVKERQAAVVAAIKGKALSGVLEPAGKARGMAVAMGIARSWSRCGRS